MTCVTAGVLQKDGRIMIYKRPQGKKYAGLWEFPGGKIEGEESPEEALRRELREELAIEVSVGRVIDILREGDILLMFYGCSTENEPKPQEGGSVEFARIEDLSGYAFAPLDDKFLRRQGLI
ncbi:MAG: (deoxy)nucleoside triphosphate pyrophosphohydrolase [Clostridia bacterium]|nr:(deoxy)nucleoside triphosphate pyrophosphohydrolase [Clostridia bacterium]